MSSPAQHWTESLLPEGLRRRMCELLRHEQNDGLDRCPLTDAQAVEQLVARLETLEHVLEEHAGIDPRSIP